MPRVARVRIDLRGVLLRDATGAGGGGSPVDLGALRGVWILTAIRHRF